MKKHLIILTCILALTTGRSAKAAPEASSDTTLLTSDGVKLYLKISGHGSACIFVHGGPGAWSKSFERLGGNALEQNLTMYYYDQRGSGRSDAATNEDYSLARMVEDIENIRAVTGVDKVYLLAHSFGGILAYNYALKYPQHIKGLILLNATLSINHSLRNQINFANQKLGTSFHAADSSAVVPTYLTAITALRQKGIAYQMLSDNKQHVRLLDSIDTSLKRNYAFGQVALGMAEYFKDFTVNTDRLNVPVLVISGTKDHNIGPDHYKLFRFPDQRVQVIDGGHLLYYEMNDAFLKVIREFLR